MKIWIDANLNVYRSFASLLRKRISCHLPDTAFLEPVCSLIYSEEYLFQQTGFDTKTLEFADGNGNLSQVRANCSLWLASIDIGMTVNRLFQRWKLWQLPVLHFALGCHVHLKINNA